MPVNRTSLIILCTKIISYNTWALNKYKYDLLHKKQVKKLI